MKLLNESSIVTLAKEWTMTKPFGSSSKEEEGVELH